MTVEAALVISLVSLAASLYFNIMGNGRAARTESKQEAAALTTVIVKLETISSDVKEIKKDLNTLQDEQKKLIERVAIVEQSAKSAHKRLDQLEAGRTG